MTLCSHSLSDAVDLITLYAMVYPDTELLNTSTDTEITRIQFIKVLKNV